MIFPLRKHINFKQDKIMSEKFQSKFAYVNKIKLHYVTKGKGKLIMFIHGFPEFWGEWENQLTEFSKDHQAVALDMRGYNLSSKPDDVQAYNVENLIEDIRSLTEHLGHKKFIMVAHDWGGAVAWSFTIRHPELLEKLVIINAPHPAVFARELLNSPEQQNASAYMLAFRSPGAEEFLSQNNYASLIDALSSESYSKWKMSEETRRKYIEAWSQPGALTGGLNYYRVSPLYPPKSKEDEERIKSILKLPKEMFEVKVPTLVIWGELDHALLPGNLDGLKEYVSDLTLKRIPDATHWVVHEQPELVNTIIREFIENKGKLSSP
jgi:pimeloyl-ACP methyl ester carboxylesterase